MKFVVWAWMAVLAASTTVARAEIFVCEDDKGHKTYQNTGNTKGCRRLDTAPLVTVPATRPTAPARATSPEGFPKVDGATQRTRDDDRRRILQEELKSEQDKLAQLRAEYNNGEPERRGDERNFARYQERVVRLREEIERSEASIGALQRELGSVRP